jgi:dTMP kinase
MSGYFISVEGGEGRGKTTQLKLLSQALKQANISFIQTREPGGSTGAEHIRELIVKGKADRWSARTETLLLMAARSDHIEKTIQPALDQNSTVLCDRFLDSTLIYQGISKGLGIEWVMQMHHLCLGVIQPNITLLFDIESAEGLKRAVSRANDETRFESMDLSFHEQVRSGFQALQKNNPHRYINIDASQSIHNVHNQVIQKLNTHCNWQLQEVADAS